MAEEKHWVVDMKAEPVIPAWGSSAPCQTNGAELQRAIVKGFSDNGEKGAAAMKAPLV